MTDIKYNYQLDKNDVLQMQQMMKYYNRGYLSTFIFSQVNFAILIIYIIVMTTLFPNPDPYNLLLTTIVFVAVVQHNVYYAMIGNPNREIKKFAKKPLSFTVNDNGIQLNQKKEININWQEVETILCRHRNFIIKSFKKPTIYLPGSVFSDDNAFKCFDDYLKTKTSVVVVG